MSTANQEKQIQEPGRDAAEPGIAECFAPIVLALTLAGLILTVVLPLIWRD